MIVNQSKSFKKASEKLHRNQKDCLNRIIKIIVDDPSIGDSKIGDLSGIYVYKFKMINQETLLAYFYNHQTSTLTLLKLGPHENFYRDLKKINVRK